VAHVIDDLEPRGFFALQVHAIGDKAEEAGRRILFRNLRIQTADLHAAPPDDMFIRDTVPNGLAEAERAQGWRCCGTAARRRAGAARTGRPSPTAAGRSRTASSWWRTPGAPRRGTAATSSPRRSSPPSSCSSSSSSRRERTAASSTSSPRRSTREAARPSGLEFQLLDDEVHPDAKLGAAGNRTLASLYDLIPRGPMPGGLAIVPKVGEWQHARVVAFPDGRVEHWLNGIRVVEYRRGSPLFAALVARSKYEKMEAFGLAEAGRLLLQDHGNHVRFRSIKVRSLARSSENP
jgi:hypothetical protein